jgi:hypothetical protein
VIVPEHAAADRAEDFQVSEVGVTGRTHGAVFQPAVKSSLHGGNNFRELLRHGRPCATSAPRLFMSRDRVNTVLSSGIDTRLKLGNYRQRLPNAFISQRFFD